MKWRIGLVFLFVVVMFATVPTVSAETPDQTMQAVFAQHMDFPCVLAGLTVPDAAHVPVLDAFAKEKGLDANKVNCYFYTWRFEKDERARLGYYKRPLALADQAALHYADVNAVTYALGGQPAYDYLSANGERPVSSRWARYPMRLLRFVE